MRACVAQADMWVATAMGHRFVNSVHGALCRQWRAMPWHIVAWHVVSWHVVACHGGLLHDLMLQTVLLKLDSTLALCLLGRALASGVALHGADRVALPASVQ